MKESRKGLLEPGAGSGPRVETRSGGPHRPWGLQSSDPAPGEPGEDERSLFQRLRSRLVRFAPRPLVRALARPYIAGESRQQAVDLVRRLWEERGLHCTVDVLGEAITERAQVDAMMGEYLAVLDDLGRCPHANVSIKLSALGQGLDDGLCARNLETILERAASYDQFVRFDMEDATTVDSTLAFYRRFAGRFPRIGLVLQSRLFRTTEDIGALASLKPNVRLCIGIYRERPEIAFQDKPSMKARLLELLETMWRNGQYVGLATHDERVIREALSLASRLGVSSDSFEVQMLLGVPRAALQKELTGQGVKVRLYVPYGEQWYQYCLRRLEHNPEMASLVLKNLFRLG
jgi:proline dehydrogenase